MTVTSLLEEAQARIGSALVELNKPPVPTPPANTSPPVISGKPESGQTLTCSAGSWTGTGPITESYQWRSESAPITGATASTYLVAVGDQGHRLDCVVNAHNSAGEASVPSNVVLVVIPTKPGQHTAPATPVGLPAPSGGWAPAVMATAFGAPIGTGAGQDPTFGIPNWNGNVSSILRPSQVTLDGEGLHIAAVYSPNAQGSGKNYISGEIDSCNAIKPVIPGSHFAWSLDGGSWALVARLRFPKPDACSMCAFWSGSSPWQLEIDHQEWDCWGIDGKPGVLPYEHSGNRTTFVYNTSPFQTVESVGHGMGFDPTLAFHDYATVVHPDNSMDTYIDGKPYVHVGSPPTFVPGAMKLKLTYDINTTQGGGFTDTSPHILSCAYVAVYRDAAHSKVGYAGGGIAPGTVLA